MVTRAGFTIVEVIVSLVLFAIALLGLAAVSAVAAATMGRAVMQERVVTGAAAILDSLAFDADAAAGEQQRAGITFRWSVDAAAIEVRARAPADTAEFVLRGRRMPRLPLRAP